MQLLFHMFSTLMSLEDRLKVEIEISLCMAINAEPSLYTQYYRTVPCVHVHMYMIQVLVQEAKHNEELHEFE